MKLATKLLCCFSTIALISCVPTISKVYQAPRVIGQVIDLATLDPIEGVNVAHQQSTDQFVITNQDGEFELPSIADTEFKMLMAGHAFKDNLVTIYNQTNQITLIARATLNGTKEETVNLGSIVFDSQPKTIAAPLKSSHLEYNLLKTYFYPHSLLGSCNHDLSSAALSSLNVSRKLVLASKTKQELMVIAKTNYAQTLRIWQELKLSCERTNANYQHINKVFDRVEQEAHDLFPSH